MHRLPLIVFSRVGRWAALGILITLPAIRAQATCSDQVTNLISWLKSPPPSNKIRVLYAIVASNSPTGVVTYTSIRMKVGTVFGTEWLTPVTSGKQYYSNVTYGTLEHPFAPDGIKTNTITVRKTGSVTVKPHNGSVTHTFTAKCEQGPPLGPFPSTGVMHGFQPPAAILQGPSPYYTISWIKTEESLGPS